MCLVAEIIHSCSHEEVAQAAVSSMGTAFAGKVGESAGVRGLSIGAFTARAVKEFGASSGEAEREAILKAMHGSDQPILLGLKLILSPLLETDGASLRGRMPNSNPSSGASERRTFTKFQQAL